MVLESCYLIWKWKLVRNDPFYIFLKKDSIEPVLWRKLLFFKLPLIRTVVFIDAPPPTINTHIYLGMFEFIFGQENARDWST